MDISIYVKGYNSELSIIDNCIQLLKETNNEKTLEHVIKVSKTGIEIANNYDLDKNKVEIACYLHDISAIIPKNDYIEVCETNNIEVLDVERQIPLLLHQKVSRLIAQKIFNITDNEILNSIESHTTLRDKPNGLDMAVFIADKLSWDKEGIPPFFECVSKAIKISLEKACLEYINYSLDNNMILIPHPMLIAAKKYLENNIQKKNKMKIGIDVDGVIFDYMVTVRAYAELYDYCELHKNGLIDKEAMKVGKRYDWTKEELRCFADKFFVELSKSTPFNPLAIEIIKKLTEEGYELYIISNRGLIHEEAIKVIEERFIENDLKFNNLFWKVEDKTKILLENKIDIIIDDSPTVCEDAINNEIFALYFREKNSKKLNESGKLFDVDNWGQIYRYIKNIEKE